MEAIQKHVFCGSWPGWLKCQTESGFGLSILKKALRAACVAPKREFASVEEFQQHFQACDEVIIEGTEQRIERPQELVSQKASYSGKKSSDLPE